MTSTCLRRGEKFRSFIAQRKCIHSLKSSPKRETPGRWFLVTSAKHIRGKNNSTQTLGSWKGWHISRLLLWSQHHPETKRDKTLQDRKLQTRVPLEQRCKNSKQNFSRLYLTTCKKGNSTSIPDLSKLGIKESFLKPMRRVHEKLTAVTELLVRDWTPRALLPFRTAPGSQSSMVKAKEKGNCRL